MFNLPSEISEKIFHYLNRKDTETRYFVCKSWYSVAIRLNWEEVKLNDPKIGLVKSHLNDSNYWEYFKYGHLIKKLTIINPTNMLENIINIPAFENIVSKLEKCNISKDQYKFSKQEILLLLDQLPNLGEIDIGSCKYLNDYLTFLLDADKQGIDKINVIPSDTFFTSDVSYDLYFLACYKFRESISCTIVNYCESTLNFNSQEINVLNSLTQFKQLTQLEFYNDHDINLTPYHVKDVCPRLKNFKFVSAYPISENIMLRLLEKNNKLDLNSMASLTHLDLGFPSLPKMYTKYLIEYFPNQLIMITIRILFQGFFSWTDIVGMKLALKLMEKLGKVKETYIVFETNIQYLAQANEETNMTKYFKLLNAFKGTRQTHCSAEFTEEDFAGNTMYSFGYGSNGDLRIKYGAFANDFNNPNIAPSLPDKTSSIIGPEIFNKLELLVWGISSDVVRRTLSYSLLNCPKLENFGLESWELNLAFTSPSLRLKLEKDLASSDPTNRNINCLQMSFIRPAQYFFDLVSTHLHTIEAVSLTTYDWSNSVDDSVMNLTCFKKLKTFDYFTLVPSINESEDNDFVLLKYTNGEERYYYLDKEKRKNAQLEYSKNPTAPCLTIFSDASVSFYFDKQAY